MSKWDRRMLSLAQLVSSWSRDPSTQVGAAIVDAKNRVVSLGFNGFPRGVTHPPCARCAAKLIQAGVVRVVAPEPPEDFKDRWAQDMASAAHMFEDAGVDFTLGDQT